MKNVHLIPTDRPSRLRIGDNGNFVFGMIQTSIQSKNDDFTNQHIYITSDASDEEIKVGDWVIAIEGIWKNTITKITGTPITDVWRKIILTTDQDLIKEGVQAIDDKFLEWFVKNPSCEEVEVELFPKFSNNLYGIIIPQEEPKQEWNPTQGEEVWIKVFSNWSKGIYIGYDVTKETHIVREDDEGGGHLMSSSQVLPYCEMPNKPKQETLEEAFSKELKSKGLEFSSNLNPLDMFNLGAKWQAERMYSELELEVAFFEGRENTLSFNEWFEQFKKK